MVTARTETSEREGLLGRLRALSERMAANYEGAPLADLRRVVESAEAQRRWYEAAGIEDMAAGG